MICRMAMARLARKPKQRTLWCCSNRRRDAAETIGQCGNVPAALVAQVGINGVRKSWIPHRVLQPLDDRA